MFDHHAIRPATTQDREALVSFLNFEYRVYRHLDWNLPQDWLGSQPFYLLENSHVILAALACPIDPPGVAWVHLFAHSVALQTSAAWKELFQIAYQDLFNTDPRVRVASLGLQPWFSKLLVEQEFILHQSIITLAWHGDPIQEQPLSGQIVIRPMLAADLEEVSKLDAQSFEPIWILTPHSLQAAFRLSAYATVVEFNGQIAGYQISTANFEFAHLARLAVGPAYQGHSLGRILVNDMLKYFTAAGVSQITVNTQSTNQSSQALYKKAGFVRTGDSYPVYLYPPVIPGETNE
jgi:ribosomal protein S18 acetylase RimI-like enzyme